MNFKRSLSGLVMCIAELIVGIFPVLIPLYGIATLLTGLITATALHLVAAVFGNKALEHKEEQP